MNWFLINLPWIGGIGLVVFVLSFTRFKFEWVKPKWPMFVAGLLMLLSVAGGIIHVISSPPGRERTDNVEIDENQKGDLKSAHIERLTADWDSDERIPNWPVAETMALLSDYAYLSPFHAEKKFRELGFADCVTIVQGSMISYVVWFEESAVVVFRGTDFVELSDWLSNAGTSPFDTPHGKIHSGFYNAYHTGEQDRYYSMKRQVDEVLEQVNPKKIWVCGHSLGGALALVCAYDLEETGRHVDGLITFGQPLLARQELADYLDSKFVGRYARFAVGEDVVTKVAPGHSYCGSLVHFINGEVNRSDPKRLVMTAAPGSSGEQVKNKNEIEPMTEEELNELLRRMGKLPQQAAAPPDGQPLVAGAAMIEDHSMERYIEKIRELFK